MTVQLRLYGCVYICIYVAHICMSIYVYNYEYKNRRMCMYMYMYIDIC